MCHTHPHQVNAVQASCKGSYTALPLQTSNILNMEEQSWVWESNIAVENGPFIDDSPELEFSIAILIIEGSLEVKLPTIRTDGKAKV